MPTSVWAAGTRTLTSFGTLIADIWGYTTRTLTSIGSGVVADIATAVWGAATRTLSAFGFNVTVGTNLDKADYYIEGTKQRLDDLHDITAASVWSSGTRTLTSFGTLVADIATAVWQESVRSLTTFGTLIYDVSTATATAVWAVGTRTLTSFSTVVADVVAGVWSASIRTLSAFGFSVTVGTNADKAGYSISGTKQTLDALNDITADSVWTVASRTLTAFGTLVADIASAVWAAGARTLTAFGFTVTASTVTDKSGYTISGTKTKLDDLHDVSTTDLKSQADNALAGYDSNGGVAKENSVLAIQNNTNFVAGIPEYYVIPITSYNVYKIQVYLYDTNGNMEDPDSNDFGLKLETAAAVNKNALLFKEYACSTALDDSGISGHKKLERESTGTYYCYIKIAYTESVAQLMYQFAILEGTKPKNFLRTSTIVEQEPGAGTLADNTTNADIIAKAMKARDVSALSAVSGSIHKDIMDNIDTIPTNPMLNNANGSTFTAIPDMAKESTTAKAATSANGMIQISVGFMHVVIKVKDAIGARVNGLTPLISINQLSNNKVIVENAEMIPGGFDGDYKYYFEPPIADAGYECQIDLGGTFPTATRYQGIAINGKAVINPNPDILLTFDEDQIYLEMIANYNKKKKIEGYTLEQLKYARLHKAEIE